MPSETSAYPESFDGQRKITRWAVWGDCRGSKVFSEAFYKGLRIIFQFSMDPICRQTVQSRIVSYHDGIPAADETETLVNGDQMREAVGLSIAAVWNRCSTHRSIKMSDVVVEIHQEANGRLEHCISHLSIYEDYLEHLLRLDQVLYDETPLDDLETFTTVDISSLTYHGGLEGRSDNKLVRLQSEPDKLYVFKGIDFVKYLRGYSNFCYWRNDYYNEIRAIRSLLPHPNIVHPAVSFVTTAGMTENPDQAFVCGTLSLYLKNGNVNDQVIKAKVTHSPLHLAEKAKWCLQMVSAISHTHSMSQTYHQDIKPSNFLVDDDRNLRLIGWEQSGATRCTIAPEADGSYDVEVESDSSGARHLLYKKYEGPERVNHPVSWPHWNVFPIWNEQCPEAVQAAEVFSLGRTMWMLLNHMDQGDLYEKTIMPYWKRRSKTSAKWKAVVNRCLESDANKRIKVPELLSFWEAAQR